MKILIIFTGGTIGSTVKGDWISTDSATNYMLLDRYRSETGDNETQFDILSPCTMLSENLTNTELNAIIESVCTNLDRDYDGIIVTHGTDTLQYTAAALSYAVSGTKLPIVLVSSDYPLSDSRANGAVNFRAAVEFIRKKAGEGVFAAYKNDDEDRTNIHSAARLSMHRECSGNIYSIDGEAYACYDGSVILNGKYKKSTPAKGVGAAKYSDKPCVLTVECRPCDSFDYSLEGVKAVILRPYHSGTLNTANAALADFCEKARERGIPVFLVNAASGKTYESAKLFESMGLAVLPLSAYPAIFVKCWLAVSMKKDVKEFVEKNISEEFCE
ncbi:MAG: asparaginase [Clostridia bacterium]|nr:asparaginase [Clostridia bacterium]